MYLKLVLFTCIIAFCAVVFSAYARLSDAGLGCSNWPACYEENALKQRLPPKADLTHDHSSWQWKLQNLVGALLGILTITISGYSWRYRKHWQLSPMLPMLLVGLMAFLSVFGILAFSYLTRPVIVIVHLAGGMAMLMMLTWLLLSQLKNSKVPLVKASGLRVYALLGLVLVIVVIIMGGWVSSNFAALACNGLPLCNDALIPAMDFSYSIDNAGLPLSVERLTTIHWMHRAGALVTLCYMIWLFLKIMEHKLHRIGYSILLLVIFQFSLGAFNLTLSLPLVGVVLHNAVAMLLLVALVELNFRMWPKKE